MHTRRTIIIVLAACAIAFGGRRAAATGPGDPLPGLSAEERARFDAGRQAFEQVETADDGLGPVFNGTSCAGCHNVGGTGAAARRSRRASAGTPLASSIP